MLIEIDGLHHDEAYWHRPNEFIPERFDPEHEYYFVPGTNKIRDPNVFIPFSTGARM